MGNTRGLYIQEFPVGTTVTVLDRATPETFRRDWHWHSPLEDSQPAFAGQAAKVKSVSFYHGGDELYEIEGIHGTWREARLIGT